MIFGAMAAWQAWLLLIGAAALAAGLFLIKLRPPRILIPSLLLWRRVLDEAREQTLWERIRRAVSLVLTIVIALALALAATRPARGAAGGSAGAGRVLVVLDASWSMQAQTRSGETRWERAVAEARRLFSAASGSELALATTADGLVEGPTTDVALIETALDRVRPGGDRSAWPQLAGTGTTHFLTDGATTRALDPNVVIHSVFEAAANVGVTALTVRPSLTPANAAEAYLEIANFAPAAQRVHVTLHRGATSVFDRHLDMGANELLRQVVPLPRGGDPSLGARVAARHNALEADDEAFAWVDRARPLDVMVVGERIDWLRAAFERDPDIRATFIQPAAYRQPGDNDSRPDVVIFDRFAPPDPPPAPALLFAPSSATSWLTATPSDTASGARSDERRPRWAIPGTHPVVQGVDPFTLSIDRARVYSAPSLIPVARSVTGTPLLSVSESPESRLVVVAFGPDESNLTAAPGFPVLLGNALEWLARPNVVATTGAGANASMPSGHVYKPGLVAFEGAIVKVTGPRDTPISLIQVGGRHMALLREPGLYTVEGGGARSTLAVNVGTPQLSNLTRTTATASGQVRAVTAGGTERAWWLYCALAAFGLALLEWFTWQRRITV